MYMCCVLHFRKPLVFLYMRFLLLSPVWYGVCLFVCLLVYFVSGVILCVCLVCMNLNINYSTSNKPKSQQLQSTWHSHKRPSADGLFFT